MRLSMSTLEAPLLRATRQVTRRRAKSKSSFGTNEVPDVVGEHELVERHVKPVRAALRVGLARAASGWWAAGAAS